MTRQKLSRNDPCPCGSGKKYKHCCHGEGIDWSDRLTPARPAKLPCRLDGGSGAFLGPYHVVDTKLKSIARGHPDPAAWKPHVERLSDASTAEERLRAYKVVRDAKVIPEEAAEYTISWAIQWLPAGRESSAPAATGEEDIDEETASQELDQQTLAHLRRFGVNDLAEMFVNNRLEFDRRYERGRQFFHGPPDEELARHLKSKSIID
jgi:hypothetical protein